MQSTTTPPGLGRGHAVHPSQQAHPAQRAHPGRRAIGLGAALILVAGLGLAACGGEGEPGGGTASSPTEEVENGGQEAATLTPRIAYTYDGGIQVRDATSLELVADIELEGFNRLNPLDNGRDLMVTTDEGFRVLDLGVWQEAHGDHSHYYTADPVLTDQLFKAVKPVHVVAHDGNTALFDDDSGHVMVFESAEAEDADRELREFTTASPHHGVAVPLPDGTLVVSEGTEAERTGAQAIDVDDAVIATSSDCPGLHGEGVTAGEVVAFGCADGVLTYLDGEFGKIASPGGRISTLAATEDSPVALGNYTVEGDSTPRVALVDTAAGVITPLELPAAYGSNGFGRFEDGGAVVLGVDGKLHFIDVVSGAVTGSYQVVDPWELPAEAHGSDPIPRILVLDGMVYVTDTAGQAIHVVDPATGEIWKSVTLDVVPGEIQGVDGSAQAEHHHDHGDEDGHEDE
jgi:hypothetical protein